MAEDVFSRRDKYEVEQRKKKTTVKRTAVSISCCLVAVMSVAVWKHNELQQLDTGNGVLTTGATQPTKENKTTIKNEEETTSFQGALPVKPDVTKNTEKNKDIHTEKATLAIVTEPNENQTDGERLFCYLNEITGSVAGHPMYRDPALHYTEEYSDTVSAEYYGIDLAKLSACMPEGMTMHKGVHKKIFENSGTLVEERSEFVFKGDDSRAVYIRANRLGPVSDCLYMSDSDLSTTFMTKENGEVKVKVFFAEDAQEMFGCKTLIVADFTVNGVNYRITTENLNLKREFRPILEEMIGLY